MYLYIVYLLKMTEVIKCKSYSDYQTVIVNGIEFVLLDITNDIIDLDFVNEQYANKFNIV